MYILLSFTNVFVLNTILIIHKTVGNLSKKLKYKITVLYKDLP